MQHKSQWCFRVKECALGLFSWQEEGPRHQVAILIVSSLRDLDKTWVLTLLCVSLQSSVDVWLSHSAHYFQEHSGTMANFGKRSSSQRIHIYLNPNIFYSAAFVLVTCLVAHVTCRHGRTLRQGSLTNDEMRIVHGMMEAMEDDGDMANMEVLPAPVSRHPARGSSDRCKLGSKSYCPGEILFK